MSARSDGLARLGKAAAPTLLGFLGVILLAAPLRLAEGVIPTPILPLFVVFFWSLYAPNYLPSVCVFLIGLLQDFLTGGPLGLWPAVYLVTRSIAQSQRSYFIGREQQVVFIGFAFAAAAASLILWTVMSLMSGVFLPIGALALQIAVTLAAYPLFSLLFRRLRRRVVVEV